MTKSVSIFFISLFLTFIVTPTVVTMIENCADVSLVYAFAEEEQNNNERTLTEIHSKILNKYIYSIGKWTDFPASLFVDTYILNWDTIYFDPISPPPEIA